MLHDLLNILCVCSSGLMYYGVLEWAHHPIIQKITLSPCQGGSQSFLDQDVFENMVLNL